MKNREEYINYFAWLRAIACVAIVVLHAFFMGVSYYPDDIDRLAVCMAVRNMCLWAVPCFVMVTGALLLDKEKSIPIERLYKVYILRMVIVLLVFVLVFMCFDIFSGELIPEDMSTVGLIKKYISLIASGGSWLHVWYLYLIIGIYIMLPVYRTISAHSSDSTLKYYLLVLFIFQAVIPTISQAVGDTLAFYICVFTIYPLYLFLGYALHNGIITVNTSVAVALFLICSFLLILFTWYGQTEDIDILKYMGSSYASLPVVGQSLGIFAIIKNKKDLRLPFFIDRLDKCSFGIFLFHVMALKVIYRIIGLNPFEYGGYLGVILTAIMALAVSWIVTFLLKQIPVVKKYI